ncbi:hypothetical protein EBU24_03340 [bacterium]|nr:hypothetical protein [bacterium]
MTSIEWLMEELYNKIYMIGNGRVLDEILEQAKEMHYKETMNAMQKGMELQEKENNRIGFRERNGLLSQQEISDEEIWEASINYDNGTTYETPIVHFQQGAFWYREQLKQL